MQVKEFFEPIKWTQERERELGEAMALVARYQSARREAIAEVARAAGVGIDTAAILVDKADAVRDALKPFDSVIRAKEGPQ